MYEYLLGIIIWKKNKEFGTKYCDVIIPDKTKKHNILFKKGCDLKIIRGKKGKGLVWTQKNWKKLEAVFDAQHIWI